VKGLDDIESVVLILTARCNLACSYCYQGMRRAGEMEWGNVCASLNLGLGSHQEKVSFVFLGGEPLLSFPLVRQAVEYAEARSRPGHRVDFRISSNGILLQPEMTLFLEEHHIEVQLSFDGIVPAQDLRASGTFPVLDRLLDNLRETRPGLFRDGLRISMTLIPPAIPHLAESVSYFIGKGCEKIAIEPLITHHPLWGGDCASELECQLSRMVGISLDHLRRSGKIPLLLFTPLQESSQVKRGQAMCGAVQGRNLTVDVDGQVYGCTLCVESVQEFRSPLVQRLRQATKIGELSRDFPVAYQRYLESAHDEDLLNHREKKYSSYGRCADCSYYADCTICPVSIAQSPGNMDPHRVPDFPCAFNRVAQEYRRLFLSKARQARGAYLDQLMLQFQGMVRESEQQEAAGVPAGTAAARNQSPVD
jgi:radical SAM protein with 4Fe4S-binding SPASM domain